MTDVVVQAANPDHDVTASRELLALMDEAATSREHWKIQPLQSEMSARSLALSHSELMAQHKDLERYAKTLLF